MICCIEKKAAV